MKIVFCLLIIFSAFSSFSESICEPENLNRTLQSHPDANIAISDIMGLQSFELDGVSVQVIQTSSLLN